MKSKFQSLQRRRSAVVGALGLAILSGFSAGAANPVVNGDFESPLISGGVTNWAVAYVVCGPGDFAVRGRTTAAGNGGGGYGASFRPLSDGLMHAYFTQTVSGLIPYGVYAITDWMCKPASGTESWFPKVHVFMEAVGGLGSVVSDEATNVWQQFAITNTADGNGQMEIRLHFNKSGFTSGDPPKWNYIHSWFDDVSMVLVSAPITYPPYRILSFTLTNEIATFKWETVSNQLYRILVSPDLSTWTTFQDNLLATGTNLTFTTNVPLVSPQFFRIHRQ